MFCSIVLSYAGLNIFLTTGQMSSKTKTNYFWFTKLSMFKAAYFYSERLLRFNFFCITCARVQCIIQLNIFMIMSHSVLNMTHRFRRFSENKKLRFFDDVGAMFFFIISIFFSNIL